MYYDKNWSVIIPMANESADFHPFIELLKSILDLLQSGDVYLVVDSVSKDNTLQLCHELSAGDKRFHTVWSPENKNVVDAYMRGYREAYHNNHEIIIEMDAGMSHDPRALPMFLRVLAEGNDCAFGSRFINGGSMVESPLKRRMISKTGTILSNVLLGSKLRDMTSGYQGFHRHVVKKLLDYKLLSKAHFYQTEIRYLLRNTKMVEVPIHYRAPSNSVSQKAITNSFEVLFHYFFKRLTFNPVSIS